MPSTRWVVTLDLFDHRGGLGEEIRRTLVDLDEVEKELKKAAKAIDVAAGLTSKYRVRLQSLCDGSTAQKKMPKRQQEDGSGISRTAGV